MPTLWIHSGEAGFGGAIQQSPGDFACKAFFTRILCHLKGHLKGHAIIGQAWQSRKGGFVQLHLPKGQLACYRKMLTLRADQGCL